MVAMRWNGRERAGSVTRMQMSGVHNAVITVTDNGASGPSLHPRETPSPILVDTTVSFKSTRMRIVRHHLIKI